MTDDPKMCAALPIMEWSLFPLPLYLGQAVPCFDQQDVVEMTWYQF